MQRILVVDDDDAIAEAIFMYLRREGFTPGRAATGPDGVRMAGSGTWDLILLDVMLPGFDGFEVCRQIRTQGCDRPILFLTARGEEIDQVLGLGLGADDYIMKPFAGAALMARIKAHLRRYRQLREKAPDETLHLGDLEVDLAACEVRRDGEVIPLTAKEFELLRFFATHAGRVLTKGQIYEHVWRDDYLLDDNTVMVHIRRLREKIERDPSAPRHILTVRGLGYRFSEGA